LRIVQASQATEEGLEQARDRMLILGEPIDKFPGIERLRQPPQIASQQWELLDGLTLRHQVKGAAVYQKQVALGKQADMPGQPAGGPPHALGKHTELAVSRGKEHQQAVTFPKWGRLQRYRARSIGVRWRHTTCP
jgi:hypothetical protein